MGHQPTHRDHFLLRGNHYIVADNIWMQVRWSSVGHSHPSKALRPGPFIQRHWCYSIFWWALVSSPPLQGIPGPMFLLFMKGTTPLCKLETKPFYCPCWLARHCQSFACLPILSSNLDPVSLTKFPFGLLHRDSALPSPCHLSTTPLLGLPRLQSSWCTAVPCSLPSPVFQVSL